MHENYIRQSAIVDTIYLTTFFRIRFGKNEIKNPVIEASKIEQRTMSLQTLRQKPPRIRIAVKYYFYGRRR